MSIDSVNNKLEEALQRISDLEKKERHHIKREKSLRESEATLRRFADNAKDMLYRMRLSDGSYEFVSKAAELISGYTADEWMTSPMLIAESIHPDWSAYFNREWEKLQGGNLSPEFEYQFVHKSGDVRWFFQRNTLVTDEAGKAIAIEGIVTDITERKKSEVALRESQNLLEQIANTTPELIYLYDLLDQRNVYANTELTNILGYTSEQVQKMGNRVFEMLLHPDDISKVASHHMALSKVGDNVLELEYRMKDADGQWRWLYSRDRVFLRNEDGSARQILGVASDVTEKKETENLYSRIIETTQDGFWILDREGTFVDVNQAAEDYSGYKKEQLKTMNICQINKLDINVVLEKIRLSQSGSQTYFELKHHTADGKILDVEIYTSKLLDKGKSLLITTVHDITNKKIAEKENIKLSQVVHQSPISIVITDPNGLIEYSNPNNCKITGYKLEELIGQNPRIFKSGKFPDEKYAQLWQTIKAGGIWSGELYNKKKDGSYYWEYARITSIIDQQGRTTNYVKIGEDITSRKKLENKLQRISIKAEESERLKTSFLANMSHEIRTPLNGILGFTNLMMDDDISTEIREKYGNTIKESSEQLMMIVNDLVRISQLEAGTLNIKYSKFNINQLVNETVNLFEEECRNKNITTKLTTNFCDNYSFVSDKKRIRQVLDNLVKNAIKFTDKGQILIGVMCKKNHLQFSVEDTGIGIKPADQKIIFDRFRQLEDHYARHFGGNGLGLSISKEIIELLGGEIWVESEYGKGAKFQFTIPLEQDIEISKTLKKN